MTFPHRKTFVYFALSLALIVVAVFWVGADTSWAQVRPAAPAAPAVRAPATSGIGSALGSGALQGLGNSAGVFLAVAGVLLIIYGASTMFLTIVGNFLDNVFSWNIMWNPSTIPVVLNGWTTMRDLANGFFILIVLWIAITIIFNLDSLGGKKLLVRVIVIALLINFSLLMVSAVFGFANKLAEPFHNAIGLDINNPESSLSKVITAKTFIHETAQNIASSDIQDAFKRDVQQQQPGGMTNEDRDTFGSLWRSLGGAHEAQAVGPAAIGVWIIKWFGPTIVTTFASVMMSVLATAATVAVFWRQGMSLILADVFLLALLMAFVTMTVLLLLRLAAMIFLGILAPIAFISLVIPRYGERFWNQWLSYLFNWAFMAPVFYFMLYIALLFQDNMFALVPGGRTGSNMGFSGNVYKMLALTMFLALLWTGIITARKMGGAIADTALTFGKKLAGVGLGVGTGLAARWALPAAGRFATRLQEKINQGPALVRSTFGRGLTAYGLGRVTGASRQQVVDAESRISKMGLTSAEIQRALASGRFRSSADVAGAVRVLQKSKDLKPIAGVQGYDDTHVRKAADTMRNLQLDFVPFLRANPTIATAKDFGPTGVSDEKAKVLSDEGRTIDDDEATRRLAWKLIRPGDLENMDLGIFKDPAAQRMFLEFGTGDHFSRLGRLNTAVAQDIQTFLEQPTNQPLWDSFSDAKKQYFRSSTAQSIGVWRVPPYAAAGGTGAGGGAPPTP